MGSAQYAWDLSRVALADTDGVVAVLKIFMDESGVHHGSPVVTVAAYFGRPKTWKAFTIDWNRAKGPIKVFHATDCANLRGEFAGWNESERNEYVAKLLPVLPRHKIVGVAIGFDLPALEAAMSSQPGLMATFGNPYTACFRLAARMIVDTVEKMGSNESLAFVHENNDYQKEAQDAFDFVDRGRTKHFGPMSLTYGAKADYVPLQAADVLAYESNKRIRDPSKKMRRAMEAINPDDKHCTVLHFPKEKMPILISAMLSAQEEANALAYIGFTNPRPFSTSERSEVAP